MIKDRKKREKSAKKHKKRQADFSVCLLFIWCYSNFEFALSPSVVDNRIRRRIN
jgi:hypothetical protein